MAELPEQGREALAVARLTYAGLFEGYPNDKVGPATRARRRGVLRETAKTIAALDSVREAALSGSSQGEPEEPEFVCSRCGGSKGEHALGELCSGNDGGKVIRNPRYRAGLGDRQLTALADNLARDRREPDKVLCYVQDLRRLASGEKPSTGDES